MSVPFLNDSYMRNLTNLVANCGFSASSIPQLNVVSEYLNSEVCCVLSFPTFYYDSVLDSFDRLVLLSVP